MAQSDARKEGTVSSEFLRTSRVADPCAVTVTSEQTLLSSQAAQFVFLAPRGSVVTLGGIDGAALRELVDQAEHIPDDRRALFVRLRPAGSVEGYVEQVIAVLAETACGANLTLTPQPASRSSCSIAFSLFLRARSMALASLGEILPVVMSVSILH